MGYRSKLPGVLPILILALSLAGCSWFAPSRVGEGYSWSLDNTTADALGGNRLTVSGLAFDSTTKPFGSASLKAASGSSGYAEASTIQVDMGKSFTFGSRLTMNGSATAGSPFLELGNADFELRLRENAYNGIPYPGVMRRDPTNGTTYDGPAPSGQTNSFTGGWDLLAHTYDSSTHTLTVALNDSVAWSTVLTGAAVPSGSAILRISLDGNSGVGDVHFADLFLVPGKALTVSEIQAHYLQNTVWSALER